MLPADENGTISYREVVPYCFHIMVELLKDEIVMSSILNSQDGLQGLLLENFRVRGWCWY